MLDYPEIDFCSQCRDHTTFEWDQDEKQWLSVCCWARPMPVDVDPLDDYGLDSYLTTDYNLAEAEDE